MLGGSKKSSAGCFSGAIWVVKKQINLSSNPCRSIFLISGAIFVDRSYYLWILADDANGIWVSLLELRFFFGKVLEFRRLCWNLKVQNFIGLSTFVQRHAVFITQWRLQPTRSSPQHTQNPAKPQNPEIFVFFLDKTLLFFSFFFAYFISCYLKAEKRRKSLPLLWINWGSWGL